MRSPGRSRAGVAACALVVFALAVACSDPNRENTRKTTIPTYDAKCLVAYMMALNQSHPLKEVKSAGAAAAPPAAASPSAVPGGQPAK